MLLSTEEPHPGPRSIPNPYGSIASSRRFSAGSEPLPLLLRIERHGSFEERTQLCSKRIIGGERIQSGSSEHSALQNPTLLEFLQLPLYGEKRSIPEPGYLPRVPFSLLVQENEDPLTAYRSEQCFEQIPVPLDLYCTVTKSYVLFIRSLYIAVLIMTSPSVWLLTKPENGGYC